MALLTNRTIRRIGVYAAVALGGATAMLLALRARAAGIPDAAALTYTGYLENPDGTPVTGTKSIGVALYDAESDGNIVCEQRAVDVEPVSGRFQLGLPDKCATAVKANPALWVEVQVEGASLGRTKLGAVPYAIEAAHAVSATDADEAAHAALAAGADGALQTRIAALETVPSGFRATSTNGAVVPNGSPRTFSIFDTETFDLANEYDPASSTFTSKEGGYYQIGCHLYFNNTGGGAPFMEAGVVINGKLMDTGVVYGTGQQQAVRADALVKLAKGDKVQCGAWQNSGHDVAIRAQTAFPSEAPSTFTAFRVKPLP